MELHLLSPQSHRAPNAHSMPVLYDGIVNITAQHDSCVIDYNLLSVHCMFINLQSIGDSGSAVTHQNLDMPVSQSLPASIDLVDTPPQDLFTDCTDTSEDECKCCMCCGQCGACLVCFHSSIAVFSLSYYFDFNHHISQPTSFGSNV